MSTHSTGTSHILVLASHYSAATVFQNILFGDATVSSFVLNEFLGVCLRGSALTPRGYLQCGSGHSISLLFLPSPSPKGLRLICVDFEVVWLTLLVVGGRSIPPVCLAERTLILLWVIICPTSKKRNQNWCKSRWVILLSGFHRGCYVM